MTVHVECLPDETLVKKLGFTRKQIIHHTGKSRVFADLKLKSNQIAMVDEDPGQTKTSYEAKLVFKEEANGVKYFIDPENNNKVFVLKVKLEDWILASCKKSKIDPSKFGLPNNPSSLHEVINYRLSAFNKLLAHLEQINNEALLTLKNWMTK